jgi:nucleotide-binding universal stress UspA family protein
MSLKSLTAGVERYLEEEQALIAASGGPAVEALEKRLGPARRGLRREIDAMSAWEHTPHAFARIMVAVDDSEQARWALEQAIRIARTSDAEIAIVHSIPEPGSVSPELAYAEPAIRAQMRESAVALVKEAAARVPEGIKVTTVLHEGSAARHICAAADDWNADLIVIGTHGRGMLGRLLLGGTAESVVRHSHCPVLTVAHPPPAATRLGDEPAEHTDLASVR